MLRRQGTASVNQSSDFDLAVSFGDALFCISSDRLNRETAILSLQAAAGADHISDEGRSRVNYVLPNRRGVENTSKCSRHCLIKSREMF